MSTSILVDNSLKTEVPGFGDYVLPEGKTFDQVQTAAKTQKIVLAVLFGILAIGAIALIQVSIPLAVLVSIGFCAMMIKSIVEAMGIANRTPPLGAIFPAEKLAALPKLGEVSDVPCSGFPTVDGPDSQKWKEELIKSARHSIVLSGCYCGGRAFEQTLALMKQQLLLYPDLKISILASDAMILTADRIRLDLLTKEFANQFTCIITPEVFPYVSPTGGFAMSTNHTKALVIDYGAYFMVGGTGITSTWTEQKGVAHPVDCEGKVGCVSIAMDSILKLRAFRDMDFVFRSDMNGAGTRLYVEMTKLFERMRHRGGGEIQVPDSSWPEQIAPTSQLFTEMSQVGDLKVACYANGPEHEKNSFLEEMIAQVEGATESIVICNLYFHPPKRLLDALITASNRNVKIVNITNKDGSKSPRVHALYAERSSYYARKLFEGREKANVELFEFAVPQTTMHKKVMIIDGKTTLVGTANIGKKSLENFDYEVNLKIESEGFAAEVARSIEEDKLLCERVPAEESHKISCGIHFLSSMQSLLACFV